MTEPCMPKEYLELLQNPTFQEIMDFIEDIVLIIDSSTTVIFVNKAYEETFHLKKEVIIGKKLSELEEDATAIQAMRSGNPLIHKVDYLKSVNIDSVGVSFPLRSAGEVVGGVSVFNNISRYLKLASKLQRSREMDAYLQEQLDDPDILKKARTFITVNPHMKRILGLAIRVASSDATVLIRGESGTGKEVIAEVIHSNSPRSSGPFVKVNCAAIPDNLLESELFGYAEGAFTGARRGGRAGKFELANGGTIFLDEIGDMDPNMQVKLLRVLQEKEVERVGGNKTIPLDVRIVTATNQNLEQLMEQGKFRRDLYYRLNVISVNLTPLRSRKDDIPVLVQYFTKKISGEDLGVTKQVLDILTAYDWPGNVRELQNVLEHACILREGDVIDVSSLPQQFRPLRPDSLPREAPQLQGRSLKELSGNLERDLIIRTLKRCRTRTQAIRELGISRSSFYEKLKIYQIEPDQLKSSS